MQIFRRFFSQPVSDLLHHQRIVPVELDQAVKHSDILIPDKRMKRGVEAPVLIHIPEITVPLTVKFRLHAKIVIIAFEIAVFP